MIIKNIQFGGKPAFSAMGMDYAAQQKKQELEMKKKSEGEPDLGYVGSFSGMKCSELSEVGDRLECHYDKFKYVDPLAKMEPKRKLLSRKRIGRHKFAMQRMCKDESPMLCATKDRDDEEKEKEPKCMEINACPEPHTELSDIIDDSKDFYKLLIKAIDFGEKKTDKKKGKSTKELSKLRKKMQKELDEIKKEYDALLKAAPAAPAAPAAKKGGSIDPNMFNRVLKYSSPINQQDGGAEAEAEAKPKGKLDKVKDVIKAPFKDVDAGKATGTTGCKNVIGVGKFDADWKKYKKCVLDMTEGAPKDGAELIESTKQKFKTAPLIDRHLQLLEKYHRKKKMMLKTTSSSSQKAAELKKKAKGKLAAYKVAGQKAKDSAKKVGKSLQAMKQGSMPGQKKKNMEAVKSDPRLAEKLSKRASGKAEQKLADINVKRDAKGLPPLSKADSKKFLDKETSRQSQKLMSDAGAMKTMKKDIKKSNIQTKALKLDMNKAQAKGLKTSKKTLKKLKAAQGKIDKMAQLKGVNGQQIGKVKATAMVMSGLAAKQGKTKAERKLAKSEGKKAVSNAKLGPMATSMKSAKKLSKAQNKIKEKLDAAKVVHQKHSLKQWNKV